MILSDTRILEEIENGSIKIVPYCRECLGSNSYDVHLGKFLATYKNKELDAKKHNTIEHFDIPEEGIVLYPHEFYLGVTEEYTETHAHVFQFAFDPHSSVSRRAPDLIRTEIGIHVETGQSRSRPAVNKPARD